jgi:hypothetical protein
VVLARLLMQHARVLERMDGGFKLIARLIVEEKENKKRNITRPGEITEEACKEGNIVYCRNI